MFSGSQSNVIIGPGYVEITQLGTTYCLGYTINGVGIKTDVSWNNITHMATLGYHTRKKVFEDIAVRTTLLEPTLNNLKLAWAGYGFASPGTCFTGGDETQLPEIQLKFIGPGPGCIRRELTVWRVVAFEAGEYIAIKNAPSVIPVIFRGMMDLDRLEGERLYRICDFPSRQFNLLSGIEE